MSDSTPRLPARPSLEQLRKQAKELLQQLRSGDKSATARLHAHKPEVSTPILADAQYVIAREHGFESWPKLVHHIHAAQPSELDQHRRIAEDLVAVYNSGDERRQRASTISSTARSTSRRFATSSAISFTTFPTLNNA